jgi:hypothetical protein
VAELDRAMSRRDLSGDITARAGSPARAVVHAAGMNTEYLRTGRGGAVVLVVDDLDAAEVNGLVACLADRHLVFAASPTLSGDVDLFTWFNAFLEGLGVSGAHLFVHSSMTPSLVPGDQDHV